MVTPCEMKCQLYPVFPPEVNLKEQINLSSIHQEYLHFYYSFISFNNLYHQSRDFKKRKIYIILIHFNGLTHFKFIIYGFGIKTISAVQ